MTVGSALQTGLRLLVDRPADVLPVYLVGIGLTATVRVPLVVAIGAALALLVSDGRLETLVTELEAFLQSTDLDPAALETTPPPIPSELEAAVGNVFSPGIVALLGGGVIVALLVGVVAGGLSNAAVLHGIYGALVGDDGVRAALGGLADDWPSFIGLSILQTMLTILGFVPIVIGVGLFALSPAAGLVATAVGVVLGVGLIVVSSLLLAFAGQSIVADDVGLAGGVRRSARLPVARPWLIVGYVLVALTVFAVLSILGSLFSLFGVSQLSGIVGPLLLLPFLDIFKFGLYADRSFPIVTDGSAAGSRSSTAAADRRPHRARFVAAFRDGLVALGGFLRRAPLSVLFATAVFTAAAIVSYQVTAGFGAEIPTPAEPGLVFGSVPIDTFVMLAANNWLVSATATFGGLALGVPTGVDMLLNGGLIGALYGVTDSMAFLALVAPHGIIELPAIFVAGGLGFHIAAVVLGVLTGGATVTTLVDTLRLAYRVLLGLAVVLVVAALIEAFLTPAIAAAVL
ncbi:stage II sporulation protein M [Halonotius sp. F2-221B]|uniref:stage II sporulation protein M n=1 Tax=Halonotius sp. F2-221B TaxID=2731620 RepID=UPI00398B55B4